MPIRRILWLGALLPAMAAAAPAEDHWTREMDPADAAALERSAALLETDRYCLARPILERLRKTQPANADVFNMLGYVHRKMGNLPRSADLYMHALYLKPDHPGALEYQGELFLLQNDPDAALANLERLEDTCAAPCAEYDTLAEAIRVWQSDAAPGADDGLER